VGRVKIQTMSKNSQQYYTQIIMSVGANFVDIYLRECVTEVCEAEWNWYGKSS